MKDLLLYAADADAEAFLREILRKHQALGVRPIDFDIARHPQKDAGMVQSGAELTRMKKREYHKAFLFWDHHGSGRDHRQTPEQTRAEIQEKLDSFTWKRNSAVIIFVPELEEWLWRCESALLSHWRIAEDQLQAWLNERAEKLDMTLEALKSQQPKELFEYVMRERLRRTISPRDFAEIGKQAGITGLSECGSFRLFVDVLREWFPMR